jgi:hypothetical protein
MYSLAFRLLPYLMVLGGGLLLLGTLPTIMGGAETAPTTVAVTDVTAAPGGPRWLKLTGGGLYLPDAVVDEQVKKSSGARKVKAWYVPLISEAEAVQRARALVDKSTTRPAAAAASGHLVLVRFDPDAFLMRYPTPEKLNVDNVYRPSDITGVRSSNVIFPQRLKDYIRAELQMPLDRVVVIKYGDKPMQRDDALKMAGFFGAVAGIGLLWVILRWRPRPAAPPPPMPPMNTPMAGPPPLAQR